MRSDTRIIKGPSARAAFLRDRQPGKVENSSQINFRFATAVKSEIAGMSMLG